MRKIFFFLISWTVVAFGQPAWSSVCALLAGFCGYALFWHSISSISCRKKRFTLAAIWYGLAQLIQMSWLTATEYHGIYILFVYGGLAIWLGLQFGLLSIFNIDKTLTVFRMVAIASLWSVLEWGRLFILCGFAWNPVGLALTSNLFLAQSATIAGVSGLSFLVICMNLLFFKILHSDNKMRDMVIFGGTVCAVCIFGVLHVLYHNKQMALDQRFYRVGLIQTALKVEEKAPTPGKTEQFIPLLDQWQRILDELKGSKQQKFDLIVMPEATLPFEAFPCIYPRDLVRQVMKGIWGSDETENNLPGSFGSWVNNAFWVQTIANLYGSEVIIGLDHTDPATHLSYNSAFHFSPHANHIERYDKRKLLPLAEYLPFHFLKPLVAKYGITDFFSFGKQAKVISGKVPLSLSICYEECFAHLIQRDRKKGAQMIVNVSNDGYFPSSKLAKQHFDHGRIRAIENGIPLVTACNRGIAAAVDSLGRIVGKLDDPKGDFLQKGMLVVSLPLYSYHTLYAFWGDSFLMIFNLAFLSLFFYNEAKRVGLKDRKCAKKCSCS